MDPDQQLHLANFRTHTKQPRRPESSTPAPSRRTGVLGWRPRLCFSMSRPKHIVHRIVGCTSAGGIVLGPLEIVVVVVEVGIVVDEAGFGVVCQLYGLRRLACPCGRR